MKILQHRDVLSIVLAGGMGERLYPLTRDRAKPAVPFGGRYRIIDFVLNNLVNSGLMKIKVLTQFKSNSLIEHIMRAWRLNPEIGQFVDPVPAQMRRGPHWFRGTADAVYQNLDLIFDEEPSQVCVFGGDHVYVMDVNPMLAFHEDGDHDLTIAAFPVPLAEASRFGVLEVDETGRVTGFEEKPKEPREIPGVPGFALASMGNYIFRPKVLREALENDALQDTSHDFGKTIIPALLSGGAPSSPTTSREPRPGRRGARPLLARHRDGRLLLGGVDGPDLGQPPAEPLQREVGAEDPLAAPPSGEVRLRRLGLEPDRRRDRLDGRRRLHRLRRHASTGRSSSRASGSTRTPTSRRAS